MERSDVVTDVKSADKAEYLRLLLAAAIGVGDSQERWPLGRAGDGEQAFGEGEGDQGIQVVALPSSSLAGVASVSSPSSSSDAVCTQSPWLARYTLAPLAVVGIRERMLSRWDQPFERNCDAFGCAYYNVIQRSFRVSN